MPSVKLDSGFCEYQIFNAEAPGQPVVLLHEGLGCISRWTRFPAVLANLTQLPLLVYNRQGYGYPAAKPLTKNPDYMHHEAEIILPELLAKFSIKSPWLIGHSDGASIAAIHAGSVGSNVKGLVLIAPHFFVEERTLDGISHLKQRFIEGVLENQLALFHEHPREVFLSWSDIWTSPSFSTWNIDGHIKGIRAPTLVIQGDADEFGSLAQLEYYISLYTGRAKVNVLPGRKHSPHLEAPSEIAFSIQDFMNTNR